MEFVCWFIVDGICFLDPWLSMALLALIRMCGFKVDTHAKENVA